MRLACLTSVSHPARTLPPPLPAFGEKDSCKPKDTLSGYRDILKAIQHASVLKVCRELSLLPMLARLFALLLPFLPKIDPR